jgi:hypothetical protein
MAVGKGNRDQGTRGPVTDPAERWMHIQISLLLLRAFPGSWKRVNVWNTSWWS